MKYLIFLQSILFACLGVFLLYYTFNKTNFVEIATVIKQGNHWVMIPVLFVSVLVYYARVKRWQLLFETIHMKAPANYLFAALGIGYLVNFAVPRLGEITRALILKRTHQFPLNTTLSTIIFERTIDTLCLVIILIIAFFLEWLYKGNILTHFVKYADIFTANKLLLILLFLIVLIAGYLVILKFNSKMAIWMKELVQTFFKLTAIKHKTLFFGETIAIWLGFYLMTYLWFFMFAESISLSAYQAFQVMVLGVVARSLPIQAGSAGAYHFVVSQSLLLFGVSLLTGNALAIVIHGFQTILTLVFGFCAYIWLFFKNRQYV
ncbi:MAG: flippase-like domain-containing protein [Bacteroidia bacterium]|nr:flippase-like domain-containing protein [Bacteroidia bacterium]